MTRKIVVTAHYPRNADELFAEAVQVDELAEAMRGIARYDGLPSGAVREGETYMVDITLFGVIKTPDHRMHVETLDPVSRVIQSRESNAQVSRWDHTLSIQPRHRGCIWTDTVMIEAERMEWLVARFAAFVYARRHRRRGAAGLETRVIPL